MVEPNHPEMQILFGILKFRSSILVIAKPQQIPELGTFKQKYQLPVVEMHVADLGLSLIVDGLLGIRKLGKNNYPLL